jgi:hypothetical protein
MGIAAGVGAQGRGIRRGSPSWCVHIDPIQRRLLTFLTALQAAFRSNTGSSRSGRQDVGCGNLLIPERSGRDGSPAAVRSPAPGSPERPRFEPSTRGSFRKRVGPSNLNPDRMPVYGPGLRKKPRA